MPATVHKLVPVAISYMLLALVAGCQLSPFERAASPELEAKKLESPPARSPSALTPAASTPTASTHDAAKIPAKPKSTSPAVAAADDATVASVMEEARKISAANPDAGAMLLDELSRAEPKLWPLTLQQFRSRQALHEQLLKRPKTAANAADAKIEDVVTEDLVTTDRPSEEVGRLADPRRVGTDAAAEQTFATATPANMPAPMDDATLAALAAESARPAAFTADAAARRLSDSVETSQPKSSVVQATATETGHVDQALYSVDEMAPAAPPETRDWQQHLQLAVDDLKQRLADGPRSTAEVHQVVSLRMLQLMAGETESALEPIPNVSTQEQDYWSSQVFALATFLDHHRQPDDERRAAASVIHLDEAVGHLRELGSLSVRNLAFCKNVFGYGAYEPINSPVFSPGQQVTLYLEVENYHSESTAKGYSTKLGANYEIVNDAGERVAGGDFPNIEDLCQSRRRDFHVQYGLALPKTAKSGKHHLKIVIDDRQSDKRGNASIAFEVR